MGHNEYIVDDPGLVARSKQILLDYYNKHADNPSIRYVDDLHVDGLKQTAEIDTATGKIRLDASLKESRWIHLHDGYLMEELAHFRQLHEKGWIGRELSGAENKQIEDEVVDILLGMGLKAFDPLY